MEVWRQVATHPAYWVSRSGKVRRRGRLLKPAWSGSYLMVRLWMDCEDRHVAVHVLVAEAFLGARPRGAVARHLDDDPTHNHVCNLAWGSHAENYADRIRNQRRK